MNHVEVFNDLKHYREMVVETQHSKHAKQKLLGTGKTIKDPTSIEKGAIVVNIIGKYYQTG